MTKSTSFVLVGRPYTPVSAALAAIDAASARCACGRPIDECDMNRDVLGQAPTDDLDFEIDADALNGVFGEVIDHFATTVNRRRRELRAQSKADAVQALGRILEDVSGATLILAELIDEVHNADDSDED